MYDRHLCKVVRGRKSAVQCHFHSFHITSLIKMRFGRGSAARRRRGSVKRLPLASNYCDHAFNLSCLFFYWFLLVNSRDSFGWLRSFYGNHSIYKHGIFRQRSFVSVIFVSYITVKSSAHIIIDK